MPVLSLHRADGYTEKHLKDILSEALAHIGKASLTGRTVLVKPNFLRPSPPEKAITTHPLFLISLIGLLQDLGARVLIGDSPGIGSFDAVCRKAGLDLFLRKAGVSVADFSRLEKIRRADTLVFREFELPRILFEVDEIVNVPKLKTHQMMVLTLAVKNLYGCIYGKAKIAFHLTAGENTDHFARFLLDLYRVITPGINILDGIEGMEGDGPSSGRVRRFGLVAASDDALALDCAVTKILGLNPDIVPVVRLARVHGLAGAAEDTFLMKGCGTGAFDIGKIRLPRSMPANFALPLFIRRFARQFLFAYPHVTGTCTACGICRDHCPVKAISVAAAAKIDRKRCIRCYCCQELCEQGAIDIRKRFRR